MYITGVERMTYNITLIGTFRKDQPKLRSIYTRLSKQFNVISPQSIDFTSNTKGFVKTDNEADQSIYQIENKHLDAIKQSDFVVLHAPSGYVGNSAAMEIGFAYALGIPVLADEMPKDATMAAMITGLLDETKDQYPMVNAGEGLGALQQYYKRIAGQRGWSEENARDTLLLMTEEVGELARAIRKHTGLKRDVGYVDEMAGDELADIQLYLVHLANILDINLSHAVTNKEIKNTERHKKYKNI